ncbi:MAG: ketol-acid reductoisomerase, partial [Candidatus Neomarinimicrobiota bacterium]
GPMVIGEDVKKRMREILRAVQDGTFAREWIMENQAGRPVLKALREKHKELLIEKVGEKLRSMMSWLKEDKNE